MTINISAIEDIIRQWFIDNTPVSFDDSNVIFSKQNAPKPGKPWAEIDLNIQYIPVALYDEQNFDDDLVKISQVRRIPIEINSYGPQALNSIRQAMDSLHLPSVYQTLRQLNGIAVINRQAIQVQDLTEIEDKRFVERGFLSFTIEVFTNIYDDVGYFDQVGLEGIIHELKPDDLDPLLQEHPVKVGIELPKTEPSLFQLKVLLSGLIISNAGEFIIDEFGNYVTTGPGTPPAPPPPPVLLYRIIYTSTRNGIAQPFVIQSDGVIPVSETLNSQGSVLADFGSGGAIRDMVAFNHDSSKFIYRYALGGSSFIMRNNYPNPTVGTSTQLTTPTGNNYEISRPRYNNSGTKIAYSGRASGGNYDLFTINTDGSGKFQVTNTASLNEVQASWSIDDSKILFTKANDIFITNADGTGSPTQLTNTANNSFASFTRDGTKIIFISTRSGIGNLWQMDSNGSNQTQITFELTNAYVFASIGFENQIVAIKNVSGDRRVFIIDVDGTNEQQIVNSVAEDFDGFGGINI